VPGLSMVLRISDSPQGAHDATSEALRIKNSGADGVSYSGFIDGGISLAQALKQQGVVLKSLNIVGLSDPAVLKTSQGALEGALGTTYGALPIGVNVRSVKTFASAMKAAGLNPYAPAAPLGYVGADLLIKGLKVAGKCPTRASFIDNLRKVTNYDGAGMIPQKVSFVPMASCPMATRPPAAGTASPRAPSWCLMPRQPAAASSLTPPPARSSSAASSIHSNSNGGHLRVLAIAVRPSRIGLAIHSLCPLSMPFRITIRQQSEGLFLILLPSQSRV